jgi:hypothetical protein
MLRFIFALALAVSISGCATGGSGQLRISGETLLLQGPISQSTEVEFKRLVAETRVSRVLLDSSGGLVEPSLAIAAEIRDRKLDVEVIGNCFSSCANYLFPAGATKTISGLGVVGWHGNMSHLLHMNAAGVKPLPESERASVEHRAKLEKSYFASINVDEFICWFGKIAPYDARNLYFLDAEDMARFGIKDVKVRRDYARTDVSGYNRDGVVNLQYIKVDWPRLRRPLEER